MSQTNNVLLGSLLLGTLMQGHCGPPPPDLAALRGELLELHRAAIAAHEAGDADYFVELVDDEYVQVGGAEIYRPTRDEIASRFSAYLERTTFTEYRDLSPPILGVSADGSIGWSIVQVRVRGEQRRADDDSELPLAFRSAWINLYRRDGDRWRLIANVSNVVGE